MEENISVYKEEIERVLAEVEKEKGDFTFAMVADSHLDNSLSDTLTNIHIIDEKVKFDCLVHLGDFLNGNLSRRYTKSILKDQMKLFREVTSKEKLYPAPGNHDGFYDLAYGNDVVLDEDWYEATEFLGDYENLSRPGNAPYFYVDYPEKKLRLVILNSFHYSDYVEGKSFKKQYGMSLAQIEWMKNEALDLSSDWSVMLFSHDVPFTEYEEDKIFKDNKSVNGNLAFETFLNCKKERGFSVPGWFIGHHHGELIKKLYGINVIAIGSETAYVPTLWHMAGGGVFKERNLGTVSEDLWDAVVLHKDERKIRLVRFGAGEDREITY